MGDAFNTNEPNNNSSSSDFEIMIGKINNLFLCAAGMAHATISMTTERRVRHSVDDKLARIQQTTIISAYYVAKGKI